MYGFLDQNKKHDQNAKIHSQYFKPSGLGSRLIPGWLADKIILVSEI